MELSNYLPASCLHCDRNRYMIAWSLNTRIECNIAFAILSNGGTPWSIKLFMHLKELNSENKQNALFIILLFSITKKVNETRSTYLI